MTIRDQQSPRLETATRIAPRGDAAGADPLRAGGGGAGGGAGAPGRAPARPGRAPARADRAGSPAGGAGAARPAPKRPDPMPMRFAVFAGGFAALSALLATISTSAVPASAAAVTVQADTPADVSRVEHVTRVVKLPPGVKAPSNAGPNVLVTQLPAPVAKPKTVVVRTTQSGRVVKP